MKGSDVIVVGAGIGGLAAALALLRAGQKVRVLEQVAELGEVGAGWSIVVWVVVPVPGETVVVAAPAAAQPPASALPAPAFGWPPGLVGRIALALTGAVLVLGEGKLLSGAHRAEEILALYDEDPAALCAYNLKDAQLVLAILDRLRLIDLSVARSRLTGMPLDRVAASVASVDFLYLSALHRRGVVAPSHDADAHGEATAGGHVLEPLPGLYRGVVSFDFKSLYPSLIRTFQIDPLGHARARAEADVVRAPSGATFARAPGVLTEILDELFQRRCPGSAAPGCPRWARAAASRPSGSGDR